MVLIDRYGLSTIAAFSNFECTPLTIWYTNFLSSIGYPSDALQEAMFLALAMYSLTVSLFFILTFFNSNLISIRLSSMFPAYIHFNSSHTTFAFVCVNNCPACSSDNIIIILNASSFLPSHNVLAFPCANSGSILHNWCFFAFYYLSK